MAFSFRGGVVPGLRHRIQSGQGTAPATGRTPRHGTVTRLCSRPQVHAAHVPERRGTLVGCQGRLLTVCLFLVGYNPWCSPSLPRSIPWGEALVRRRKDTPVWVARHEALVSPDDVAPQGCAPLVVPQGEAVLERGHPW